MLWQLRMEKKTNGWPSYPHIYSSEHNECRKQTTHTHNSLRWASNPIQIGCCGADGSNDYIIMRQPLPSSCRDSVTGNAFFHGCVDELTWLLEDKSGWVAGLAMTLALIQVRMITIKAELQLAIWNAHLCPTRTTKWYEIYEIYCSAQLSTFSFFDQLCDA